MAPRDSPGWDRDGPKARCLGAAAGRAGCPQPLPKESEGKGNVRGWWRAAVVSPGSHSPG